MGFMIHCIYILVLLVYIDIVYINNSTETLGAGREKDETKRKALL